MGGHKSRVVGKGRLSKNPRLQLAIHRHAIVRMDADGKPPDLEFT
jgi:hypothetical protein